MLPIFGPFLAIRIFCGQYLWAIFVALNIIAYFNCFYLPSLKLNHLKSSLEGINIYYFTPNTEESKLNVPFNKTFSNFI